MKKIFLTLAAVFAFGFANAQDQEKESFAFKQGDMWAEGAFKISSFNNSSDVNAKTNDYAFTPKVGYMNSDKLGFGGFLNFSGAKFEDGHKTSSMGIGAFARYYFLTLGGNRAFNAYGELGLGYSKLKNNDEGASDSDAFNANINLGMNYFLTKNWAVVFTVANIVSYNNASPSEGDNTSDITVNINLFENPFATSQFGLLYRW